MVVILQAVAKYCVGQRVYQELFFNLLFDVEGQKGGRMGLAGLDQSLYVSLTA